MGAVSPRNESSQLAEDFSEEEKEVEKIRLHRMVRDFANEAVSGIAVAFVCPDTARLSPYLLQTDRFLNSMALVPRGADGRSAVHFNIRDITSVFMQKDVVLQAPALERIADGCVGIAVGQNQRPVFLHFDDVAERERFHTCLMILHLSVSLE